MCFPALFPVFAKMLNRVAKSGVLLFFHIEVKQ